MYKNIPKRNMDAWEFCCRWFNKDPDDEDLITRSFKSRCNQLLQERLGVGVRTLQLWGDRYENMPDRYKERLGETYIFVNMLDELRRINPKLTQDLIDRHQS
jgi:hypothetical protein